jgi:hypothetical protein
LNRNTFANGGSLLALAATATGAAILPAPAFGQAVADRTLSDLNVENVGSCTTLTVNFNIRVQMLSHFPTTAGRELHVRVRPLDDGSAMGRESLRTPASVKALRSIEFEGDNPSGPVLSLFFTHDMRFAAAVAGDPHRGAGHWSDLRRRRARNTGSSGLRSEHGGGAARHRNPRRTLCDQRSVDSEDDGSDPDAKKRDHG